VLTRQKWEDQAESSKKLFLELFRIFANQKSSFEHYFTNDMMSIAAAFPPLRCLPGSECEAASGYQVR
jgi:hypothetical protein